MIFYWEPALFGPRASERAWIVQLQACALGGARSRHAYAPNHPALATSAGFTLGGW